MQFYVGESKLQGVAQSWSARGRSRRIQHEFLAILIDRGRRVLLAHHVINRNGGMEERSRCIGLLLPVVVGHAGRLGRRQPLLSECRCIIAGLLVRSLCALILLDEYRDVDRLQVTRVDLQHAGGRAQRLVRVAELLISVDQCVEHGLLDDALWVLGQEVLNSCGLGLGVRLCCGHLIGVVFGGILDLNRGLILRAQRVCGNEA